jgi:hypothetical protein
MWVLFIIVIVGGGSPDSINTSKRFKTEAECNHYKADLQRGIAGRFPNSRSGLLCTKSDKLVHIIRLGRSS